jgi:hypothetical protein
MIFKYIASLVSMLLIEHIESYNKQFLFLLPPVKNNLIANSIFTRIIYSPPMISFNGLYLSVPFFESVQSSILQKLHEIENDILSVYTCSSSKKKNLHIKQLILYKVSNITDKVVLKISGIWESETAFGLAYKLIL